jgi:hypothetical protein
VGIVFELGVAGQHYARLFWWAVISNRNYCKSMHLDTLLLLATTRDIL